MFAWKEYNQSDFSVDRLVMSMCRVFCCVVGRGCLLWPVCFLGKILLSFVLLHSVLQGQIPGVSWLPTFPFQSPIMKRTSFLGVSSRRSCRPSYNCSASSELLVGVETWITVILNDLPWKQTEILLSFLILHPSTAFGLFCWLWWLLHFF